MAIPIGNMGSQGIPPFYSDKGGEKAMNPFLAMILEGKKLDIERDKSCLPLGTLRRETEKESLSFPPRSLKDALDSDDSLAPKIIAEVKRASPSKGIFEANLDPVKIACLYEEGGAKAISILTEERYFLGSFEDLKKVREIVSLPCLCKDFIIDEYQLYKARLFKADAVLLIVRILDQPRLKDFYHLSQELSLEVLFEIHDLSDLSKAMELDPYLIGINNRDLKSFEVDIGVTLRLAKEIPKEKTIVSESGIKTFEDIKMLRNVGVRAFLIGETLVAAPDPKEKLKELLAI